MSVLGVLYDKVFETYLWVIDTEVYRFATFVVAMVFCVTMLVLVILALEIVL